ncbi:hypothetical protein B7463_g5289, partial [Scytalidium lignicola]
MTVNAVPPSDQPVAKRRGAARPPLSETSDVNTTPLDEVMKEVSWCPTVGQLYRQNIPTYRTLDIMTCITDSWGLKRTEHHNFVVVDHKLSVTKKTLRCTMVLVGIIPTPLKPQENTSKEANRMQPVIPSEYDDYLNVFNTNLTGILPPYTSLEHHINLEEGQTSPWGLIYALAEDELAVLHDYLEAATQKGWIRPLISPARAPILFIPKPGGKLYAEEGTPVDLPVNSLATRSIREDTCLVHNYSTTTQDLAGRSQELNSSVATELEGAQSIMSFQDNAVVRATSRESYVLSALQKDIKKYISTYAICQRTKLRYHLPYNKLVPLPILTRPFEKILMDFIIKLPPSTSFKSKEYNTILVVVCKFTKYSIYILTTKCISADGVAELLLYHIIRPFGLFKGVVSDRDTQFKSKFWASLCYYLADDWATKLYLAEHVYNTSWHSAIQTSPAEALIGYKPQGLAELGLASREPSFKVLAATKRAEELQESRSKIAGLLQHAQKLYEKCLAYELDVPKQIRIYPVFPIFTLELYKKQESGDPEPGEQRGIFKYFINWKGYTNEEDS